MDENHVLRIKASMLVYSLEQALGSYVVDNTHLNDCLSEQSVEVVINREVERGNVVAKNETSLIIESSYLDEVFGFALNISVGSSVEVTWSNGSDQPS